MHVIQNICSSSGIGLFQALRQQHKSLWTREDSRKLNLASLQEAEKFKKIVAKAAESDITVRGKFQANRGIRLIALDITNLTHS